MQQIGLRAIIDLSQFNTATKQYQTGIGQMNKATSGFATEAGGQFISLGNNILSLGATAAKVAAGGVTVLAGALATFAIGGIKQAISLDQQMADIASVMGKTKEAVTPLKEEILALSLDPQLRVNASEAATAVELLARNGLTMTEILDGAAKSTIALANATRADFGVAADVATDVMAIFNIKASEMERAVDGITGVTTHSKLTIDDYALALASVGAVGEGMGLSLEDMNTVLAATASSFSSGRVAGTSLKVLLQRLAKPTEEMQIAMDKYGISLFDSEGNMRSMADIAGQLNNVFEGTATITETVGGATAEQAALAEQAAGRIDDLRAALATNQEQLNLYNDELALEIQYYGQGSPKVRKRQIQIEKLTNTINKQSRQLNEYETAIVAVEGAEERQITKTIELTEAEKAHLAATLGGADGARQIIALSKLTADEFENLSGEVNKQGQALRAAATRVDSLSGAWDIFKSVLQSVQIQVGDKFLPILRKVTVGFTDLAVKYGPKVIDFFGRIAGAIGDTIGWLVNLGRTLVSAFQTGGTAGLVAALGLTPQTTELIDKIVKSITDLGSSIMSTLLPGFRQLSGGGFMDTINAAIIFLNENFEELKGAIIAIGAVLAAAALAATIAGIAAAIGTLITPVGAIIAAAGLLGAAWAGNWFGIRDYVMAAWVAIQPILQQIISWLQVNIPLAIQVLVAWWQANWPIIAAAALTAWEIIQGVFAGIVAAVGPAWASLQQAFDNITQGLNNLGLSWSDVGQAILSALGIVVVGVGAAVVAILSVIVGLVNGVAAMVENITSAWMQLSAAITSILTGLAQQFVGWGEVIKGIMNLDMAQVAQGFALIWEGIGNVWTGIWQGIIAVLQGSVGSIIALIQGLVEGIVNFWQGLSEALVGGSIIPDMITSIINWFNMLVEPILSTLSGLANKVSEIFSGIFGVLAGGGGEGAGAGLFSLDLSGIISQVTKIAPMFGTINASVQAFLTLLEQVGAFFVDIFSQILIEFQLFAIQCFEEIWLKTEEWRLLLFMITTVTLPALRIAAQMTATAIVTAFTQVNQVLTITKGLIIEITSLMLALAEAAQEAAASMIEGFEEAADTINSVLIPSIQDLIDKLLEAEEAAMALANAIIGLNTLAEQEANVAGLQGGRTRNATGSLLGLGYNALSTVTGGGIEGLALSHLAALLRSSVQGGAVQGGRTVQINFNAPISISNGMDWDTFQAGVRRTVARAF